VDLVALAGLPPVSVVSALVDENDGSMQSLPNLRVSIGTHLTNWLNN